MLDLERDTLTKLGPPPAPPPLPPELSRRKKDVHWNWAWEADERHFGDIEPAVLDFSDAHTLRGSYGDDDYRRRGRERRRSLVEKSR